MYILVVHHVLFLSSNHLEISVKHSFTSSDSRLLCLTFAFTFVRFFHFRWLSFAFGLRPIAFVCVLVPPQL